MPQGQADIKVEIVMSTSFFYIAISKFMFACPFVGSDMFVNFQHFIMFTAQDTTSLHCYSSDVPAKRILSSP